MKYIILWHGHELRTYSNKDDCELAMTWFKSFLIESKLSIKIEG